MLIHRVMLEILPLIVLVAALHLVVLATTD
jgi:hypothetical protein